MADKLVVNEHDQGYVLQWWLEEDNDWGGTVGDAVLNGPEPADELDWQTWMAYQVAEKSGAILHKHEGFIWEEKKQAAEVLKAIKAAWKDRNALADWERKALAAGWTPPPKKS